MLISHKKRFLFVHIYKTGGTSVTRALIRHARLREQLAVRNAMTRALVSSVNSIFGLYDNGNRWLTGAHKHSTAPELRTLIGADAYHRYFTFAFVRNPWDWQCSLYHYVRTCKNHRDHDLARRSPLKHFLRYQIETNAPCQLDFLTDVNGTVIVDKIGRFETLQEDFDEIAATLGLPAMTLDHLNSSDRPRDYETCYDLESAALVHTHFARDIEQFDYEFRER